jgi:rubrerythrin
VESTPPASPPMTIGEWWAAVRKTGCTQAMATKLAKERYNVEPRELSAEARAEMLASIQATAATATAADCDHEPAYTEEGVMVCQKCGLLLEDEPAPEEAPMQQ